MVWEVRISGTLFYRGDVITAVKVAEGLRKDFLIEVKVIPVEVEEVEE